MGAIIGLLAKVGLGGVSAGWVYLGVALAIFGAGAYVGEAGRGLIDAPKISKAQKDTADAKADMAKEVSLYNQLVAKYAQSTADAERQRAADQQQLAAEQGRLNSTIAQLQGNLTKEATQRAAVSAQLSEALKHANQMDIRILGPAVLTYLDGVRRDQTHGGGQSTNRPAAP